MFNRDKICPVLMSRAPSNMDRDKIKSDGAFKCLGYMCAFFRGDENRHDGEKHGGICCVPDIAGWLCSINRIADDAKRAEEEQERKKQLEQAKDDKKETKPE